MSEAATQLSPGAGLDPRSARVQAEAAFHDYLDRSRAGAAPQIAALLGALPFEVRTELELIFDDYLALRGSTVPQAAQLSAGTLLSGFELVREIGRGGMGCIWEARQRFPRRLVALKILYPHLSVFDQSLERFHKEAQACGRLQHDHIVAVHEVGEHQGLHWIAMELVPGGLSLADRIVELRERPALPADHWKRVARLVRQTASALWAAHEAGIVHRDIKPGNILLTPEGRPKVADFGLARMQDDLSKSRSGRLSGTPYYMSPEQAASSRLGVDARTDIYSLGVTLYEAACLVRPYEAATQPELLERILLGETPDPRAVRRDMPRDLAAIVMKMMAKRREARYASMAAVIEDLDRFLAGERVAARLPSLLARAASHLRRRRALASGTAISLLGLAVASGVWWRMVDARDSTTLALEQALELVGGREVSGGALDQEATARVAIDLEQQAAEEEDAYGRFRLLLSAGLLRLSAEQQGEAAGDLGKAHALLPAASPSFDEEYQLHDGRARCSDFNDRHDVRVEALVAAAAVAQARFDQEDPRRLRTLAQLAAAYLRDGRAEEARIVLESEGDLPARLRRCIDAGVRQHGGDRMDLVEMRLALGELLWRMGRSERLGEAGDQVWAAIDPLRRMRGPAASATLSVEVSRLQIESQGVQTVRARDLLSQLADLTRRLPGGLDDSLLGARIAALRGDLLAASGESQAALASYATALTELEFHCGRSHPATLALRRSQARLLRTQGAASAAVEALRATRDLHMGRHGASHEWTLQVGEALADAERRLAAGG